MNITSRLNKNAWKIRREASEKYGVKIMDISWKHCLILAGRPAKINTNICIFMIVCYIFICCLINDKCLGITRVLLIDIPVNTLSIVSNYVGQCPERF